MGQKNNNKQVHEDFSLRVRSVFKKWDFRAIKNFCVEEISEIAKDENLTHLILSKLCEEKRWKSRRQACKALALLSWLLRSGIISLERGYYANNTAQYSIHGLFLLKSISTKSCYLHQHDILYTLLFSLFPEFGEDISTTCLSTSFDSGSSSYRFFSRMPLWHQIITSDYRGRACELICYKSVGLEDESIFVSDREVSIFKGIHLSFKYNCLVRWLVKSRINLNAPMITEDLGSFVSKVFLGKQWVGSAFKYNRLMKGDFYMLTPMNIAIILGDVVGLWELCINGADTSLPALIYDRSILASKIESANVIFYNERFSGNLEQSYMWLKSQAEQSSIDELHAIYVEDFLELVEDESVRKDLQAALNQQLPKKYHLLVSNEAQE